MNPLKQCLAGSKSRARTDLPSVSQRRKIGPSGGNLTIVAGLFFATFFFGIRPVAAFCPEPNPPRVCTEFFRANAVFVGTVTSIVEKQDADGFTDGWVYSLQVDKDYRGAEHSPIEVFSPNDSGRFPMQKGRTYVLFPIRSDETFQIYGCGNSSEVTDAKDTLNQLGQIVKKMRTDSGGDIGGQINSGTGSGHGVGGIRVTARGNGRTYSTVTNSKGKFHIRVPAGSYTIHAKADKWAVNPEDISYESPEHVEIYNAGCADLVFSASPHAN